MIRSLKEIREEKGLTQIEASKKLEITKDYLSLLENSKRQPSIKMINKLAKVYREKPEIIFLAINRTISS
jgi:transcriptional regulator with XRE-family HTH domain